MIDSSKFPIVEAGLKWVQGKSIVNSISLKVSAFCCSQLPPASGPPADPPACPQHPATNHLPLKFHSSLLLCTALARNRQKR